MKTEPGLPSYINNTECLDVSPNTCNNIGFHIINTPKCKWFLILWTSIDIWISLPSLHPESSLLIFIFNYNPSPSEYSMSF